MLWFPPITSRRAPAACCYTFLEEQLKQNWSRRQQLWERSSPSFAADKKATNVRYALLKKINTNKINKSLLIFKWRQLKSSNQSSADGTTSQSLCLSGNEQTASATARPLETTLLSFLSCFSGIWPQKWCVTGSTARNCARENSARSSWGTFIPGSQKRSAHPRARNQIKIPPCHYTSAQAGTFISLLNVAMTTTSSFKRWAGRGHEALVMQG